MWRWAIPMLVVMAVGLGARQGPVGPGRWAALAEARSAQLHSGERALSFGGEFLHPVYTEHRGPGQRRVLM